MQKIKKILEVSERANDPWFKDYWLSLADWLADRYESVNGQPLIAENNDMQKQRVLH